MLTNPQIKHAVADVQPAPGFYGLYASRCFLRIHDTGAKRCINLSHVKCPLPHASSSPVPSHLCCQCPLYMLASLLQNNDDASSALRGI